MKRYLWISIICFLIAAYGISLMGCATTGGQEQFYKAQQDFMLLQSSQPQKPLFAMKAVAGTSIQNLESLVVYVPVLTQPKDFKQYVSVPHPGWETANTVIRTAGTVAGVYFIADGIKSIFSSWSGMASRPTTETNYNQTVRGTGNSIKTQTSGNMTTGRIGDKNIVGGIIDQTSTPTIVEQPAPLIVEPAVVVVPPSYPPEPPIIESAL